ncbi:hypothetical protein [Mucilaginibacter conchicola]|nr:hypothetical protein [Mucilaginibacter conchicola]
MQPLKSLNYAQRAALLHNLLITDIPDFLSFLYEYTETVQDKSAEIRKTWTEQPLVADLWISLASTIQKLLNERSVELHNQSQSFSELLFRDFEAIFSVHVLLKYIKKETTSAKFRQAAELLFI